MSIELPQALEIVKGFRILEKYPSTTEGETALAQALGEVARDLNAAKKFVRNWIKENRRAPMPCDIHSGFQSTKQLIGEDFWQTMLPPLKPGEQPPPPKYRCWQCEDSGFYIVRTGKFTHEGIEYTAAKKCSHSSGSSGFPEAAGY